MRPQDDVFSEGRPQAHQAHAVQHASLRERDGIWDRFQHKKDRPSDDPVRRRPVEAKWHSECLTAPREVLELLQFRHRKIPQKAGQKVCRGLAFDEKRACEERLVLDHSSRLHVVHADSTRLHHASDGMLGGILALTLFLHSEHALAPLRCFIPLPRQDADSSTFTLLNLLQSFLGRLALGGDDGEGGLHRLSLSFEASFGNCCSRSCLCSPRVPIVADAWRHREATDYIRAQ